MYKLKCSQDPLLRRSFHPVFIFLEETLGALHVMMSWFPIRWAPTQLCIPNDPHASQAAYAGVLTNLRGRRSIVASSSVFLPSLTPATCTFSALLPCRRFYQIFLGNLVAQFVSSAPSLSIPNWALRFGSGGTAASAWTATSPPSQNPALG